MSSIYRQALCLCLVHVGLNGALSAGLALSTLVVFFAWARAPLAEALGNRRWQRLRLADAVFDATREGVLVTDAQSRIIHVNPAFIHITGYRKDEVIGRLPTLFSSGRHDRDFYRAMWASLAEHRQWSGEIWNRRKSGEIYPQWQSIRAIEDRHGAVCQYVAVFSDLSAIERTQRELDHLAHHDPLTQLPNRLLFTERARQALLDAVADQSHGALLLIDLDHFQQINESLGHNIGDELLKAVAARLTAQLGTTWTLARLGGDEFAVLAERCSEPLSATALAQTLLDSLKVPFVLGEQELFIGASIGISLFPQEAEDVEQLLRNADTALFKAKHSGRESYALYNEALTRHALQRLALDTALRHALEHQELRVYYQPVHDLASGRMVGTEALVRWQHPLRGLVPPGDFIPLAEQSGLIGAIDLWVLSQACAQMRRWQAEGAGLEFVAVNISSRLFSGGELHLQVAEVLHGSGLDPARLELEITETAVMDDPEAALRQLHRLSALGLSLSIDDFGTGHSSLLRLKRLPVNKLKIDQGFVAGLPGGHEDAAITAAIIALAHTMGLQVLAEGVEDIEQARLLLAQGCQLVQGYWYGRPMPAEQLNWRHCPRLDGPGPNA